MKKKAVLWNLSRDAVILEEAEIADTFLCRLKGLLGRKFLLPGRGLIIAGCRAVHTLGMSFSLDVAFVDGENRICFLLEGLAPWRFSPIIGTASYVVEAPAGTFRQTQTKNGDRVRLREIAGEQPGYFEVQM